jgi:hypothetical protein
MNTSMVRRLQRRMPAGLAAIALTAGAVFAQAPTAAAADPIRNCPPRYNLTEATFSVVTAFVDFSGNNDGWVCRMQGRNSVNVIDNHIPLDVTPGL